MLGHEIKQAGRALRCVRRRQERGSWCVQVSFESRAARKVKPVDAAASAADTEEGDLVWILGPADERCEARIGRNER